MMQDRKGNMKKIRPRNVSPFQQMENKKGRKSDDITIDHEKKRLELPRFNEGLFCDHDNMKYTSTGHIDDDNYIQEVNYRGVYRQTILKILHYEESAKRKAEYVECNVEKQTKTREELCEKRNRFRRFVMEHEVFVQIIIFLPLTLMAFYIVVVEKTPLFRVVDK